jgi:hypothetical protein
MDGRVDEVLTSSSNGELGKHATILATTRASAVTARGNTGHNRSVEVMHITGHLG